MAGRYDPDDRAPLQALVARLADDTQRLVRAEINLIRTTATFRVSRATVAVALLAAALLLAQASVTVLLVGIMVWLGRIIGPIGAALVVTLIGLGICGLLAKMAVTRIVKAATMPIPGAVETKP